MRIDPDSGFGLGDTEPREVENRPSEASFVDVPGLVKAAMAGTLPGMRPLKPWESEKLSSLHVQMILDRASGYKPGELAQKYDMTPNRVSQILHHPAAEIIIGAILATLADRIIDPIERLKAYAHECIGVKVAIMRDPTTPRQLRNTVASDLLDRAGYGARQKIDVSKTTAPAAEPLSEDTAQRLARGLEESRKVREMDYARFTKTGEEGGGSVESSPGQGSGSQNLRLGASPEGPSLSAKTEAA